MWPIIECPPGSSGLAFRYVLLLGLGVLSGVTTALFGFGGGFVTVPVVYAVAATGPAAMHVAVGTSAVVMLVNSLGATITVVRATACTARTSGRWPRSSPSARASARWPRRASRTACCTRCSPRI